MRLWHWKLIPVLPRQQLLGQWRECCLIAKNVAENGTPNHILVNPVMEYPMDHFVNYQYYVWQEMKNRGYEPNDERLYQYIPDRKYRHIEKTDLFPGWHTDEYLKQCYYNLEEKYDRDGISNEEWQRIQEMMKNEV